MVCAGSNIAHGGCRTCLKTRAPTCPSFQYPSAPDRGILWLPLNPHLEATAMEWTTPTHEVIDLNCEISSYANAEL
jgi:hypothetical protein